MSYLLRVVALTFVALLSATTVWAAIDTYEFKSEKDRVQFKELTTELRCPKCQNQNLADSNAPIAEDMRTEIHRLLEEGQTSPQIVDYMVARYGDFVRYRPKQDSSTALLWLSPIILLLVGGVVVVLVSRRKQTMGKSQIELADTDQERLQRLLSEHDADNNGTDK